MARLLHSRWDQDFRMEPFSTETSMRDHLFAFPSLIFDDESWVEPIEEEVALPESTLLKDTGRADLVLCRMPADSGGRGRGRLLLEEVEVWIVELKKTEASYEDGFEQLYDYLAVAKGNPLVLDKVGRVLRRRLGGGSEAKTEVTGSIPPAKLRGALVAHSFDLLHRTPIERIEAERRGGVWKELTDRILRRYSMPAGFTLVDAVSAVSPLIILNKLVRFRRGYEIMCYSENLLGSRAAAQVRRSPVDPADLFAANLIKVDDIFFFRDHNGRDYRQVECVLLTTRAEAGALKVELRKAGTHNTIRFPRRGGQYTDVSLPYAGSTTAIAKAILATLGGLGEQEANDLDASLGDWNFVRQRDSKVLLDLRSEL